MNYYKANETVHDVMLRAANVPMMYDNYLDIVNPEHEYIFADLGGRNPVGYDVDTFAEDEMSDYVYRVVVKEVPKEVCKRLISMNPTDISLIKVGDSYDYDPADTTPAQEKDCNQETNRMVFYFDDRFGGQIGPITACESDDDCVEGFCCENNMCEYCENQTCTKNTDCKSGCCGLDGMSQYCGSGKCCTSQQMCGSNGMLLAMVIVKNTPKMLARLTHLTLIVLVALVRLVHHRVLAAHPRVLHLLLLAVAVVLQVQVEMMVLSVMALWSVEILLTMMVEGVVIMVVKIETQRGIASVENVSI